LFAEIARLRPLVEVLQFAKVTGLTLLNSNANFVAQLPNGSVGETLISVNHVISANVMVIM
jgi:hypothetical protein